MQPDSTSVTLQGVSALTVTPPPGSATYANLWCPPSQSKFYAQIITPVAFPNVSPNGPPSVNLPVRAYTSKDGASGTLGSFGILADSAGHIRLPISTASGLAIRALDAAALAWVALGLTAYDFDLNAALIAVWSRWVSAGGPRLPGGGGGPLLIPMGGINLA